MRDAGNGATWAHPMTRVMQTTFGGGDDPELANRGDCFPACLASLLGLESADGIPRWYGADTTGDAEANWWNIVAWLQARGLTILAWEWPASDFMVRSLAGAVVIVSGVSPRFRDGLHAVLGQVRADGTLKLLHDPHPSGDFIVGEASMVELVIPMFWPVVAATSCGGDCIAAPCHHCDGGAPPEDPALVATECGTCGEFIRADALTGTACACTPVVERCESGDPDCGPVEFHDDDGVPLCARCWGQLPTETATQRRAREAGISLVPPTEGQTDG